MADFLGFVNLFFFEREKFFTDEGRRGLVVVEDPWRRE